MYPGIFGRSVVAVAVLLLSASVAAQAQQMTDHEQKL